MAKIRKSAFPAFPGIISRRFLLPPPLGVVAFPVAYHDTRPVRQSLTSGDPQLRYNAWTGTCVVSVLLLVGHKYASSLKSVFLIPDGFSIF
jgi:hypothetical protein